jgi:FkbM family methyltransferase
MSLVSYSQRFEDLYLMRCFADRSEGFYIDIGSGHPVYDNVSFAFYLKGWRGITVEPNPWLSRLSRAVRPRDHHVEALVGARSGAATFYQVRDFHGLSTMVEGHAQAALSQFGKRSDAITVPLTTLAEICAAQAPASFDFLKIDVEGAEAEVIKGGDWRGYRPKLVVIEALAPYTLTPAHAEWEPLLAQHGYAYVWFDSLNRYYLASEANELADCFANPTPTFDDAIQFRDTRPALADPDHPDHRLATLLSDAAMTRLPVLDHAIVVELLTQGLSAAELDQRADDADLGRIWERLFGPGTPPQMKDLRLRGDASIRSLYAAIAESDAFRAACGRISASYGW